MQNAECRHAFCLHSEFCILHLGISMIEGIDRTIDLVGARSSGLTGAREPDVVSAIRRCDASTLAATDGHFAAIARDGRTVRLARTVGIPLRYFVAKMYHGPFLVVS